MKDPDTAGIRFDTALPPIDTYRALFETTGWNEGYRASTEELRLTLERSWCFIAAWEPHHGLVGIGRVVSDGVLYGMIYDVIVHPSHQGRGIGTAITDRLIDRCRQGGLREIQLFSAEGKAGFYRRFGFEERPPTAPGMRLRPGKA